MGRISASLLPWRISLAGLPPSRPTSALVTLPGVWLLCSGLVRGDVGPVKLNAGGLHLSTGCGIEEEDGQDGASKVVRHMWNNALWWGWMEGTR